MISGLKQMVNDHLINMEKLHWKLLCFAVTMFDNEVNHPEFLTLQSVRNSQSVREIVGMA